MKKNDLIKKLLPVFVVISMLLSTAPIAIAAVPEADGTEKVSTEQELRFALSRDSQPKLTNDIKLTSCLVISNRATILLEGKKLYREMSASADDGHVIEVKSGGNLTIKNRTEDESVISGGYATQGGGILNSGTLKIENIKIAENIAKNGGGIYSTGVLELNNVKFEHNTAEGGEGGNLWTEKKANLTDVTVSRGKAKFGGGIFNKGGVTLNNVTAKNNEALDGGSVLNHGILTANNVSLEGGAADGGGGGNLWNDSMANLTNVKIIGGYAQNGGGIANHGSVIMKGCTVTDNEAAGKGAGIYFNSYTDGRDLSLNGNNTITENTGWGGCAGVYVDAASKGNFVIQDTPVIKGNRDYYDPHHNLYLEGDKKIRISDKLTAEAAVYLSMQSVNGIFTVDFNKTDSKDVFHGENKEEITEVYPDPDNESGATELHLGVYRFTLVKTFKASDGSTQKKKSYYYDLPTAWDAAFTEAKDAEGCVLTMNGSCETSVPLIADVSGVTLDLNGYTLKRTGADKTSSGEVITVRAGAVFTVSDSSPKRFPDGRVKGEPKGGVITGGSSEDSGGAIVVSDKATLNLNGGTLYKNSSQSNGGAICVKGTLHMRDAAVRENTAANIGGGLYVDKGGTATVKSSTFTKNTASHGGAIENYGGTLTLSGCKLSENSAGGDGGAVEIRGDAKKTVFVNTKMNDNTAQSSGGAIYVNSNQLFLSDCEIQNNRAPAKKGGGVFVQKGRHISVQGKMVIAGNLELTDTRPKVTNVALAYDSNSNQSFIQNAGLSEDSRIGLERVHSQGKDVGSNQVLVVKNCTTYQKGYFFADSGKISYKETGDKFEVFMATAVRPFGYAVYPLIAAELVTAAAILTRARMKKKEKAPSGDEKGEEGK